jgi:hypothetical protein
LPDRTVLTGPPYAALFGTALFDDTGALWIRRIATDADTGTQDPTRNRYLVVPTNAGQQQLVDLPAGFALLAVQGELLLGVRRGDYDTQYVEILRLSR